MVVRAAPAVGVCCLCCTTLQCVGRKRVATDRPSRGLCDSRQGSNVLNSPKAQLRSRDQQSSQTSDTQRWLLPVSYLCCRIC
jgi:hypothetical protein